jgi:hypothetical protein
MNVDCFMIVRSGEGWLLQWNGRDLDSFSLRANAMRAATAAARMSVRRGRAVEIVTQDEGSGTISLPGTAALAAG